MIFHYKKHLAHFWIQLANMLEDSYLEPEHSDAHVLLGCYVDNKVLDLKRELNASKIIVYQTEPLIDGHWFSTDRILKNIEGADEIWDYDLQNIEMLRKRGIEAKFKPPAYSDRLRTIKPVESEDIDVLFYGSITDYRHNTIRTMLYDQALTNKMFDFLINMNFVWLYNITDHKLDDYIARSKVILNMRPYENATRQQQTRIYYPIINNKCVLSEKSEINYFGDSITEYEGVDDLSNKLYSLIQDGNWRVKTSNYGNWIGNKKTRSKIAIFYHLFQAGDWKNILEEQMVKLQRSGLYDAADYIHIGVNGDEPLPWHLAKINRIKRNTRDDLEADTLSDLQEFCLANPDYKVVYLHSKGVSHGKCICIEEWRRYLEYFVVVNWRTCAEKLEHYDTVGTEWEDTAHITDTKEVSPHYAGNFWWANASYINKLDRDFLYVNNGWPRWQGEFWIGTGNPNYYNFYSSGKNKYLELLTRHEYMQWI